METRDDRAALAEAVGAAAEAGALLRRNLYLTKRSNRESLHDIKLELDVQCQRLIERHLRRRFPEVAILGEEGSQGASRAADRWVIDPIDGTVNFAFGIPHACVSIALQARGGRGYETVLGVVYDPFVDECWTALRGKPARLNGEIIRVSDHVRWSQAIVTLGFAKSRRSLEHMLPWLRQLTHRVRKIRIMGSAALALTYVATGRMDAYLEAGVRLWDIAAGGLILKCAGGEFWHEAIAGRHAFRVLAHNGKLGGAIRRLMAGT